jgi:hypothetical protein
MIAAETTFHRILTISDISDGTPSCHPALMPRLTSLGRRYARIAVLDPPVANAHAILVSLPPEFLETPASFAAARS